MSQVMNFDKTIAVPQAPQNMSWQDLEAKLNSGEIVETLKTKGNYNPLRVLLPQGVLRRGETGFLLPENYQHFFNQLELISVGDERANRKDFSSVENDQVTNPDARYLCVADGNEEGGDRVYNDFPYKYLGFCPMIHCNIYEKQTGTIASKVENA